MEVTKVKEDGVNGDTKWDFLGLQTLYPDLSTKTYTYIHVCVYNEMFCQDSNMLASFPDPILEVWEWDYTKMPSF